MSIKDDTLKDEFIFFFKADHFATLCRIGFRRSTSFTVRNMRWRLLIKYFSTDEYLGIFLECDTKYSRNALWDCRAGAHLTIISQMEGVANLTRNFTEHIFCSKNPDWGFSEFIEWKDVINPEKGYFKDGIVEFKVHVVANVPNNVDSSSEKVLKYADFENVANGTNDIKAAVYSLETAMNLFNEKLDTMSEDQASNIKQCHAEIRSLELKMAALFTDRVTSVINEWQNKEQQKRRVNDEIEEEHDVTDQDQQTEKKKNLSSYDFVCRPEHENDFLNSNDEGSDTSNSYSDVGADFVKVII